MDGEVTSSDQEELLHLDDRLFPTALTRHVAYIAEDSVMSDESTHVTGEDNTAVVAPIPASGIDGGETSTAYYEQNLDTPPDGWKQNTDAYYAKVAQLTASSFNDTIFVQRHREKM